MSDIDEDDPPDAMDVATRLASLPERQMRVVRLAQVLQRAPPDDAAWLLDALATAGRGGGPPYNLALLAAVDLLSSERLADSARTAILAAATQRGLDACRELLAQPYIDGTPDAAKPRPLSQHARPLTLGERKSLARSWDREILARLLTDPHADVVALLLGNPHVTQDDVLRIATARRSSSAVLMEILRSRKWSSDERIRCALVRNPNLPTSVAVRLLGLLNVGQIRDIAQDPHLPAALTLAISRRLRPVS